MKRLTCTLLFIFLIGSSLGRTEQALAQSPHGQDDLHYSATVTEIALLSLPNTDLRGLLEVIKSEHTGYNAENFYTPAQRQNAPKVPIPGAIWLLGTGVTGLATIRLRSR